MEDNMVFLRDAGLGRALPSVSCRLSYVGSRESSLWIKIKNPARSQDFLFFWLRGKDSNLRPRGYGPRELPLLYPAIKITFVRICPLYMKKINCARGRMWSGIKAKIRQKNLEASLVACPLSRQADRRTHLPSWLSFLFGNGCSRIRTHGLQVDSLAPYPS